MQMDIPISRLSYKLVLLPDREQWSGYATAIEISNPTDYSAFNLECEVLLLGSMGYDKRHFETQVITEIKPHEKDYIRYGDWTDFDICFFAIRYLHVDTAQYIENMELMKQKVEELLKLHPNPTAEKECRGSFVLMSKGLLHIDTISFTIDGVSFIEKNPVRTR